MADRFASGTDSVLASARQAVAVTPSDASDLTDLPKALYVGGYGDVSLILADDSAPVAFTGVAAGTILPVRARRVRATGTTATAIVALL